MLHLIILIIRDRRRVINMAGRTLHVVITPFQLTPLYLAGGIPRSVRPRMSKPIEWNMRKYAEQQPQRVHLPGSAALRASIPKRPLIQVRN